MYFEPQPKTRLEDLFGEDYALGSLIESLRDDSTRLIIIKGLRRIGKTSLLNVALHESKRDFVKIDVRESPFYERQEFLKFLVSKIRQNISEPFINKIIKSISGIGIGYKDASASVFFSKEENSLLFFDSLNKQLAKKKKTLILAFDEAQLLKGIGFDNIIASIFDNYKSIKILITGSEIGLLDLFLGKKDSSAPLFNRAYLEIVLRRMKEEETSAFLKKGFEQINKSISFEEIKETIENLDGIIGWNTHYGWLRYKGLPHERAIEQIKEDGIALVRKELEQFLERRKAKNKYLKALKFIKSGKNTWSLLKVSFEKEGIKISESQLGAYLNELLDYTFIEKIEEKYYVADPMLMKSIR